MHVGNVCFLFFFRWVLSLRKSKVGVLRESPIGVRLLLQAGLWTGALSKGTSACGLEQHRVCRGLVDCQPPLQGDILRSLA